MPLTPVNIKHRKSRPKVHYRQPRSEVFERLWELRARTIARADGDPLGEDGIDWWCKLTAEPRPRQNVYRRVARLKAELILPRGVWSIETHNIDGHNAIVVARFEGYREWWRYASEKAWRTEYIRCIKSPLRGEKDLLDPKGNPRRVPTIPADEYDKGPVVFLDIEPREGELNLRRRPPRKLH